MFEAHRMVYDPNKKKLYIAGIRKGQIEGTLNEGGAQILMGVEALRDKPQERAEYYSRYKPLLDDCYVNGWLNEDMILQGSVREAKGGHHLRSVQFELLLKCNLSCGYCYCSAGNDRKEIMSKEDVLKTLDDCDRLGVLRVDFTGGEFFLYPHWKEVLSHARKLGLSISVHTNGMALTEKNVSFLDEIGIAKVMVSADGDTPESHNKIRGNPRALQLMEDGLARLKAHNIPFRVNIMVHKQSKDNLLEIVDNLYKKGYTLNYDWIAPFGSETASKLGISAAEYFEAVAPLRNPKDVVTMPTACGRDLGWDSDDYEPGCGVGYSYLFITSTGEMAICPNLTSRENAVLFNGPNLKDIPLFEAWTGDPYFDKHRHVSCENVQTCVAGTSCRGGCRANAYAQSQGKLDAPNMIECNVRKNHTGKYIDFQTRYNQGEYGIVNN